MILTTLAPIRESFLTGSSGTMATGGTDRYAKVIRFLQLSSHGTFRLHLKVNINDTAHSLLKDILSDQLSKPPV